MAANRHLQVKEQGIFMVSTKEHLQDAFAAERSEGVAETEFNLCNDLYPEDCLEPLERFIHYC